MLIPLPTATILEYQTNSSDLLNFITQDSAKRNAFEEILGSLKTEAFLIEENYIDKDHLVDYTSYYARCHESYERTCTRIHFFLSKKQEGDLNYLKVTFKKISTVRLNKRSSERINSLYLGFIVVKHFKKNPLIGRTCLRVYKEKKDRFYPATKLYTANLYGIPLSVKSMAFQEQDGTTGVCASISLWSAFQITGTTFQHSIPSPSEITTMALSNAPHMRVNEGLDAKLIANGISQVGLKSIIYHTEDMDDVKMKVYAYLRFGIPVIAILNIFDDENSPKKTYGTHAVTFNGYSFEELKAKHHKSATKNYLAEIQQHTVSGVLNMYSEKITRLYAHDDQLCPFSRIIFSPLKTFPISYWEKNKTSKNPSLNSPLSIDDYSCCNIKSLIIPLPEKIRISFELIHKEVTIINRDVTDLIFRSVGIINQKLDFDTYIQWDIFLANISEFKSEILYSKKVLFPTQESLLRKSMAKYLWRAIAKKRNGDDLFEIIFDATDSSIGGISKQLIVYDNHFLKFVEKLDLFDFLTISHQKN